MQKIPDGQAPEPTPPRGKPTRAALAQARKRLEWLGGSSEDLESRAKWAIWVLVGRCKNREIARAAWTCTGVVLGGLTDKSHLPSLDCLAALKNAVQGIPTKNRDADLRWMVREVERCVELIREYHHQGVRNEAPILCSNLKDRFEATFAQLTEAQCYGALSGLLAARGIPRRKPTGVVADLILAVRAWGYTRPNLRPQLLRHIDGALRRGRKA